MGYCRLNNMNMAVTRKRDMSYQVVLFDLMSLGVITKAQAEKLLGYSIPSALKPVVTGGESATEKPAVTDDDGTDNGKDGQ